MSSEHDTSAAECPHSKAEDGPSLFQNGNLVFQAHHVGWIIASFFTLIATVTSAWLICKHLMWYTNKREQRFIVRILLLVPVYAIISLLSYFFWNHSTWILIIRDCYESTVLTAFFYLLLYYLSPSSDEQRAIFMAKGLSRENDIKTRAKGEKVARWVWPLGFIKWKPTDGLYFLQWMKWGVLQYCVIRPLTTIAAVLLEYMDLYCEASWGFGWGHIYIVIIVSISVTIAMYCLIQLYVVVSKELAAYRPLLKLFAIKAVVFLTFWQASFLSFLTMFNVIKDTKYMTAEDINIGIGALLETFEMMLFGFLHIRAFSYKPYRPVHPPNSSDPPPQRTPMLRSFLHAMNFRETFREIWQGWKYMWARMRGQVPKADQSIHRIAHYESAFGKARPGLDGSKSAILVTKVTHVKTSEKELEKKESATLPAVHLDVAAEERVERQWLGLDHNFGGIQREKSDDLEVQIERELERRGYGSRIPGRGHIKMSPNHGSPAPEEGHVRPRSWWRNIYNRISQSGQDFEDDNDRHAPSRYTSNRRTRSKVNRSHHQSRDETECRLLADSQHRFDFDDPPPPSLIRHSRGHHQPSSHYYQGQHGISSHTDTLSPLNGYNEHRSSHVHRQQQKHPASLPHLGHQSTHHSSLQKESNIQHSPSPRSPNYDQYYQKSPPSMLQVTKSSDSLFGRVFPLSVDHAASTMHTPTHESQSVYDIVLAGERSTRNAHVHAVPTEGVSVEIIGGQEEISGTLQTHVRGSASHRPLDPRVDTDTSYVSFPRSPAISPQQSPSPPMKRSKPLRRSSAQVYSPADAAHRRKSRQNSINDPQRASPPHHAYYPQPSRLDHSTADSTNSNQRNHRSSRYPPLSAGYTSDNLDSDLSQPSFSRTLDKNKYQDDHHARFPDNSRYPGLPSPRQSGHNDAHSPSQPHVHQYHEVNDLYDTRHWP